MTPTQYKNLLDLFTAANNANPDTFDMRCYHKCGTPMCLLGNYVHQFGGDRFRLSPDDATLERFNEYSGRWVHMPCTSDEVKQLFGIDFEEATRLFDARGCNNAKTPGDAAAYVGQFIADRLRALSDAELAALRSEEREATT